MATITLAALPASVGQDLGTSRWFDIGQERIDLFAEATEDRQWIHTDAARAADGPFGTTIAHGFLTLSLVSAAVEDLLVVPDAAMTVNYGLQQVRFLTPVAVGSRVQVTGRIAGVEQRAGNVRVTMDATVLVAGGERPACVAQFIFLFLPAADRQAAP